MASASAHIKPEVLRWARESIGFEVDEAAEKIGLPAEKLRRAEGGDANLTMRQAERAARAYERPLATLFIAEPLAEEPQETQFRRLPGAPEPPWPPEMVALVRRVRERQEAAADLLDALDEEALWPRIQGELRVQPSHAPERARELLGISFEEQSSWRDHSGYAPLRDWIDAVEGLGVFAMQDGSMEVETMRGFASLHDVVPAIVVNTQDDPRARAFTLVHELGHLYLAAMGQPSDASTEAWCDRFAGEVLMPPALAIEQFRQIRSGSLIQRIDDFALRFGVTPRAAAVRALRYDLISQPQANGVLARIEERGPRGSAAGGNYYRNEIGRLGPAYIQLVFSALESQAVTYAAASSLLGGIKVNNFRKLRDHVDRRAELVAG